MKAALGSWLGRRFGSSFVLAAVVLALSGMLRIASAQVPIPMQEQIQQFNALPPSQQQALIRDLQRTLPPAERDAVLSALQGQGQGLEGRQNQQFDLNGVNVLDQGLNPPDETNQPEKKPRFKPLDTVVLEFMQRKDTAATTTTTPILRLPEEQQKLDDFQGRLEKGNPYQ